MLATISSVFTSNDSDIIQANVSVINDREARGFFVIKVRNVDHLTRIMHSLKRVKGVENVERLGMA
jgi:(p)ppGpp synthase/HD superfamily hydrolase